jgi:hypothetical protein
MSNARNLANLLGTDTKITTADIADGAFQANKNLIINGAMEVAQRGTSKTFTGNDNSNYHTVDRWGQFLDFDQGSGSLSVTISQSTDVPAGQGFAYSLKGATTPSSFAKSGSDNLALFTYKVETYDATRLAWGTSGAKSVTLSYWIKSDTTGTGTLQIRLPDSSVVSGASDGNFYTKFTVNAANTWEYKTHVIPANTQDAWRNNVSNIAMHIHWYFGSNQSAAATQDAWFRVNNHGSPHSDNTYDFMNNAGEAYITGVSLEMGDVATPFEHRSFGDELKKCERYYQQLKALQTSSGTQTTQVLGVYQAATAMRASATVGSSGALQVTDYGNTSKTQSSANISLQHSGNNDFSNRYYPIRLQNFSGLTQQRIWQLYNNTNYIDLDAEL